MAEETNPESDSQEEKITEKEELENGDSEKIGTETEESEEGESFSPPIDYAKKLGVEEEEPEDSFIKRVMKNAIENLDGKSRSVVISALVTFIVSILNFIAWNLTELEVLKYLGTILAIFLLIACGLGVLISFNVYNVELKKNKDVRVSGLILSIGSVLVTLFFML